MSDHRIIQNERRINFTCTNRGFETNLQKGKTHARRRAKGSVFRSPLVTTDDRYTLWLEHAINQRTRQQTYWLMWYDPNGVPTIPASSVIDATEIRELGKRLCDFVEIP
jgi:hypothetical protein